MADRSELEAAANVVKGAPHSTAAWDEVEGLAGELERPDDVIALYREVLADDELETQVVEMIGERAASFCDEWFGDDPKVAESLLKRVIERAPQSESALQRLSTLYASAERWTDLFALYDRALAATKDKQRQIKVLREASQLAKDVAGQPEKAITYLQRLLPLTPDDVQLGQGLERLLERHERWADLIALWEGRLESQSRKDRERTRARIAACWLDSLRDPAKALAAVRPLLGEAEDDKEACALLERIIESSHTNQQVREGALDLLRAHYDSTSRPREVIRVLERVIALDPAHSQALREEAGARLAELDDDAAAMDQYAALLAHNPDSSVTQEKLRQIAERSKNYARYAEAMGAAAAGASSVTRRVELLAEAARTRLDLLSDPPGAIELYQRALGEQGIADREQLMVCRRLSELYARTDQPRERLEILDRLGELESGDAARRVVLGEAARLAESLGETDRALALWRRRIDADANDLPALDAVIALLEHAARWSELIPALDQRAGGKVTPVQRKSDLMRIAVIYADHVADPAAAIDAWLRVMKDFGEDPDTVNALADLLAGAGRWKELADLLERSATQDVIRTTVRLVRLADALREHLGQPERALGSYRSALAIDSRHDGARTGLTGLLEIATTRKAAADALAQSYRENGDWAGFLDILPARLAEASDDRTKLALYREASNIQLQHTNDRAGGLANLAAAFPLAPRDGVIEGQILDLARQTGDWKTAATGVGAAIMALAEDPQEAARLQLVLAEILDAHLSDDQAALGSYLAAARTQPGNLRAVQGVARIAPRLGRWDEPAVAVLGYFAARERFDADLMKLIEQGAVDHKGFDGLSAAMTSAATRANLPPVVAADVQHTVARWHSEHRGDDGAGAIAALQQTLALGGDRKEPLTELAALLRKQPVGPGLLDVLRRLADIDSRDLDVLVEAADVASRLGDREQAITIFGQVLGRATAAWRGTAAIRSNRPAHAVAKWAIEGLVELQRGAGRARAAVDLLVEGARLPFDESVRRELRLRAAQMAETDLNDTSSAIEMYRGVLAAAPDDLETIAKLGSLLEKEGRTAELLGLRNIQLGLEPDPANRLELRLDIARLVGLVEERGGRLEALLANLSDQPGHEPSINAVSALFGGKGQHQQLADLLEKQATQVEGLGETTRAAKLWSRYAGVAEHDLKDVDRAIAGHRRVCALQPTPESLRALALLYVGRGQHGSAVPWYESLLAATAGADRPAIVLQLARAHLGAGSVDRAIAAIESNLDDREPAVELRVLLAEQYRKAEQWEPLARHLTRNLGLIGDPKLAGEMAREAASIYTTKLDAPARAIPALEKALELDPTDKELRAQLATGLRVANRLPEARTLLGELIADFGRRRSPERATLHVELARVAQAEGKLDEALAEMEQAAKMDVNNATIQRGLAEMARAAGQVDKAEKTYRSLLLVVRRQPPGDDETAVGASEVLFELHMIAKAAHPEQAKELLESAMDAAVQSDAEVHRLRRSLIAHGDHATLLKVLELRLAQATEPASQARLHADVADVLDSTGQPGEALDAVLRALNHAPHRLDLHDKARELAKRAGATRKYVEAVDVVADRLRRKSDPPLVATLLMKAGDALEHDAGDARGAASLYKRVEMMGERLAEAYYAQARIAGALGDTDEQARALDAMLQLAGSESAEPAPEQIDALYRLAEIFIATPSRRNQGISLIERAFAAEPRWAQAGRVLKLATAQDVDPRVMGLYERVARNGGDGELLLDFLEKRAKGPDATPQQIREAVSIAVEMNQDDRAEALLVRAIEAAKDTVDGVAGAVWAVLALVERRIAQNKLASAKDLLWDVASLTEPGPVDTLALKIADQAAAQPGGQPLAAEVYEFLRERNPTDRNVWEPLIALYRAMGDADRLANVVSSTLPNITEPAERNALRRAHARYLLEEQSRPHDAIDVLRDALLDDPDDLEVAGLLEQTLRAVGDNDGLSDFLWGRFEDAQKRGNVPSIVDVANRLGALLDGQGVRGEAARVYRAALAFAPEDRDLLRQVVAHLSEDDDPRQGALLMERLLAVETPEEAIRLCQHLASLWEAAGDEGGVQRTLEAANKSAPDDAAIHDRLEGWYRDKGLWAELAGLMTRDAERATDADTAVARLREAASVYSGFLGQPLEAARVLRAARERQPGAAPLVTDLAAALAAGGQVADAVRAIGEAVDGEAPAVTGAASVDLLLLRGSLAQQLGDEGAAVADLERAYAIDPARSAQGLADGLERQRARAEAGGDLPTERAATLRLASLLQQVGDLERARTLVVLWIEREPSDAEPLYMLRDMDRSIEHWDGVIAACTRLAYIVTGEQQIEAALEVASAAAAAERPGEALPVLELVHQQQPANDILRAKLREFYEAAGAYRELAGVLLADADHGSEPQARFEAYKKAAELLITLGDPAAALEPARKACDLMPEDQPAAMVYVDALMNAGHTEQAATALETAIAAHKKRSPDLAVLQQRMGRVCALMGDKDGQLNWLKKAFDVDRKNGEVAAELAQLATEIGDYELALKPLRAITLMENPLPVTRPMALLWEAKIEHARGNRAKAELWAKKALREDPQFGEAQQFLDEIAG